MSTRHGRGPVLFGGLLVGLLAAAPGGPTRRRRRARSPPRGRSPRRRRSCRPRSSPRCRRGGTPRPSPPWTRSTPRPKSPDDRAYYALIRGIAAAAGRASATRPAPTLAAALEAAPQGPWAAKLRVELAAVELAAGRFDAAEALARAEAEALLADDRKDRLAEVYHAFARRLLDARRPDHPARPRAAPTPCWPRPAAWPRARPSAPGSCFAMARASQAGGQPRPRAIEDFQAYLKEYPEGADRDAARVPPRRGPARRRPAARRPA